MITTILIIIEMIILATLIRIRMIIIVIRYPDASRPLVATRGVAASEEGSVWSLLFATFNRPSARASPIYG